MAQSQHFAGVFVVGIGAAAPAAGGRRAVADQGTAVLLGLPRLQGEILVVGGGERQAGVEVLQVFLFEAVHETVFLAAAGAAVNLQAQCVRQQRPAEAEVALLDVAGTGIVLNDGVQLHRAAPLLGDLAGDHVDHAADGVRAVQGGHGAAHHFDPLDGLQRRQPVLLETGTAVGAGFAGGHRLAVDQDQGVLGGHAADHDVVAAIAGAAAGDDHPGNIPQRVGGVLIVALLDLLARDHADRGRRVLQLLRVPRRGDRHLPQFVAVTAFRQYGPGGQ